MFAPSVETKTARDATRARISEIDVEIDALHRSIEALRIERVKCHQELACFKYPVLTLPAEITSEIFIHFLPAYPERSQLVGPLSPSFLCRICRQWREVALSTPTLWKAPQLKLNAPRLFENQLRLLELWLQRSGACPLSIDLVVRETGNSTASFVEAILRHAHRWEEVQLILPYEELHRITGPMPLLRTAVLGPIAYRDFDGSDVPPVMVCGQAPNLREVGISSTFNPFFTALPWSQLTVLNATLNEHEAAAILRETSALEVCCFMMYGVVELPLSALPIPSILNLRSLRLLSPVEGRSPRSIQRLLSALNLPALESVAIFELFLDSDPIATLSALRPSGYPKRIEIFGAHRATYSDRYKMYTKAFPEAVISVELARESESESDESD
ncbi:hypothetical protein B0H11DRAFT_1789944 [Mycena galericulata]|nr:hypothetical protein B0H11DRAFT_1789944 [Mycena galericulata]